MSMTNRVSEYRPSRDAARGPITVMVVDDEKDPRESVCEWLIAQGYTVVPARDGADALQRLRSENCKPDVILLDLMMPGMNGWQFREQQVKDPGLADIPVIVITANRDTRGIEAHVIHSTSVAISREHRRAKTDRRSRYSRPCRTSTPEANFHRDSGRRSRRRGK